MNVLDLFSGIGGFSLGLERAGMRTVAFCEIEPFCRRVLRKHWPNVPIYEDIRELTAGQLRADGILVDIICGGFPCQDISVAGKSAGINGADSGLWSEYARLIRELRPNWIVIENSPRLRTLGADRVLSDLEEYGYAYTPIVVGAVHAGSPQIRKRAWIIAYPASDRRGQGWPRRSAPSSPRLQNQPHGNDPADVHCGELRQQSRWSGGKSGTETLVPSISDTWQDGPFDGEPVDDGLPEDVDAAIKAYGNAVVPQIPEIIGRAIMTISPHYQDNATKEN